MNDQPVHYAVLRDLERWDESVHWVGLERQPDGGLIIASVPGIESGAAIVSALSKPSELSGLAVGCCRDLYLTDAINQQVIRLDNLCNERAVLGAMPGQFKEPRGLLVTNDNLYVADGGSARVQIYRLPSLELRASWEGYFDKPLALAADSLGFIYVLDAGLKRILRFSPAGVLDETYNNQLEKQLDMVEPLSLAIDGNDTLYVVSTLSNTILRVDKNNYRLAPILGDQPNHPGALAAHGNRLYVGDRESGQVWVFDCVAGVFLGTLQDYRGSVSALALDQNGTLYIKPALDDVWYSLTAGAALVSSGYLMAGPFDAGDGSMWERVHADVDLPDGTQAELSLVTAAEPEPFPLAGDFVPALALDTLVRPDRFLWLRVSLQSDDHRRTSPLLKQVQAETTAESYMQHLPAVYRRDDASTHFLEHWLALFRAELGDLELALEEMPTRLDPLTAPETDLRWLASWLAFDPPSDLHGDELRKLLRRVHDLYDRRGTPFGMCEMIELFTGVRPSIFESFRERRIWQLGFNSTLGLDTKLADALPDGMIIPGNTLADPQFMGLRGDYYKGIDFNQRFLSRIDAELDFVGHEFARPEVTGGYENFSVRWTGQVLPRFSERYTFYIFTDEIVRLWVDGILLINQEAKDLAEEFNAAIELSANRWYSIQIEYCGDYRHSRIQLSWSSRSQPKESIPHEKLYAVRDVTAQFELSPLESQSEGMLIGQTVIGESGPLEKDDFGMPLFSETAHLFSVSVPASAFPMSAQRELLKRIIEAEKPAHTDYQLCFVEPQMRVGYQSRLGLDSIVAGPPSPLDLDGATLGQDSYLGEEPGERHKSRVGQQAHVGRNTFVS